jgi:hypothetical protein
MPGELMETCIEVVSRTLADPNSTQPSEAIMRVRLSQVLAGTSWFISRSMWQP